MFHSILRLKIDTSLGGIFELNNIENQHLGIMLLWFAAVSIQRNWVVSLDKSILYLQFLCKTSNSTFVLVVHDYVWDRFCSQCAEVNNFLTGLTLQVTNHELFGRQMRLLYVQENAHNYFIFIQSSRGLLHYKEKTFIYNLLAYVLDKFSLWNRKTILLSGDFFSALTFWGFLTIFASLLA